MPIDQLSWTSCDEKGQKGYVFLDSLTIGTEYCLKLKYLHEVDLDTTMSPTVPRPDFKVSK